MQNHKFVGFSSRKSRVICIIQEEIAKRGEENGEVYVRKIRTLAIVIPRASWELKIFGFARNYCGWHSVLIKITAVSLSENFIVKMVM